MKKLQVILVDNHEEARVSLVKLLHRSRNLELIGATGHLDGVGPLLARGKPDVILVDLHQGEPGSGGVEACLALRALSPAPLLVLASYLSADLWIRLREAGATDYLLKRIDPRRLQRELVRLAEIHRDGRPDRPSGTSGGLNTRS